MDPPQLELRGPEKSFSDFFNPVEGVTRLRVRKQLDMQGTALSTKSCLEDNSPSESLCSVSAGINNARLLRSSLC